MVNIQDDSEQINISVIPLEYYNFLDGTWTGVITPAYSIVSPDNINTVQEPARGVSDYWRKQLTTLPGDFSFLFDMDWLASVSTTGTEGNVKTVFALTEQPRTDYSSMANNNDGLTCSLVCTPDSPSGTYRRIRIIDQLNDASVFFPVTTPWGISYGAGGRIQIQRIGNIIYVSILNNDGTTWMPTASFSIATKQPYNYVYAHSSWAWGSAPGISDYDTYAVLNMVQQ